MFLLQIPDRISARFAAYSAAGVINAIVGVSAILVSGLLGAGVVLANVIGYGLGLLVSFTLNSRITFRSRKVDWRTVLRFLCGFAIAFAANMAVVIAASHIFHLRDLIASLAGTPAYVVVFFSLCEYWIFRRESRSGPAHAPHASDAPR